MKHEKIIRKLNMIEMLVEEVREEIDDNLVETRPYAVEPLQFDSVEKMPDAVREHLFNSLTTEIDHERQVDWPQAEPPTWPDREAEVAEPDPVHPPQSPAEPEPKAEAKAPDAPNDWDKAVSKSQAKRLKAQHASEKGEGRMKALPTIDWNDDKHLLPRGTRFHSMLLRQQRARYQITQDEMGKECGLGGPTLSMLERGGTRRPAMETIKKISKFTGVSPDLYVIHDARK